MKFLLDTHAFLWFVTGDRRLSRGARQVLEHEDAQLHLSAASVWEMAIKSRLGRLTIPDSLERYIADKQEDGFHLMPIEWHHAAAVAHMPWHHRDPFDRLIAAQALSERMRVVTRDRVFKRYGVDVVWK